MAVRRLSAEQPESFAFSNDNVDWAKAQIAKFPEGRQQSAVIPLLWRAQEQHEGWLPEPAIRYVADMLGMPYIRALEVATFYTMFNLKPVGKHFVQLCGTTPCMLRGAEELKAVCKRVIGPESTVSDDGALSWLEVECLGACVNAPMVQVNKDYFEDLTPDGFEALLNDLRDGKTVKAGPQNERATSEPLGGATTLTDEAAITRTPPHEDGPVDRATEPVAKALPSAADERLEEQVAVEEGEVADEIKQRQDGTTARVKGKTGSSEVVAHIPQGENRSGDDVAREKSSIESSGFAKSENAPSGATGKGDLNKPPVPTTASSQTTPPQVDDAPRKGGDTTVGIQADSGHDGNPDGALPKTGPAGSVTAESDKVAGASAKATDPANPSLGAAAKAEQKLSAGTDAPLKAAETPEEAAAVREAAKSDDQAPRVLDSADGEPDDLKRISGIGPKLEGLLNSMGFFHFEQIAAWTEENIDWVDARLRFKGRIRRDNWIDQAKTFSAEKGHK